MTKETGGKETLFRLFPFGAEVAALARDALVEVRNTHRSRLSWIAFNLKQIDGNPL